MHVSVNLGDVSLLPFKCAVFESHYLCFYSSVPKGSLVHSMIKDNGTGSQWLLSLSGGMEMSCREISPGFSLISILVRSAHPMLYKKCQWVLSQGPEIIRWRFTGFQDPISFCKTLKLATQENRNSTLVPWIAELLCWSVTICPFFLL